jgi:hypothetical protein
MARLKFKNARPPRGFFYVQPETRLRIDGEDYGALMKLVLQHRQYRGLKRATVIEVEEDVERQLCTRLSKADCKPESPDEELRPIEESNVLSVGAVMGFSKAAFDWLMTGAQVVPMEQMTKRQAVCLACPLNNPVKACSCSLFYKTINRLVPSERRHQDMHVCGACGCSTNAKVQMPIETVIQADGDRKISYPVGCWVRSEKEIALSGNAGQKADA